MGQAKKKNWNAFSWGRFLIYFLIAAASSGHILLYLSLTPEFVDTCYRPDIYPWILLCLKMVSDWIPCSISGFLLLLILFLTLFRFARLMFSIFKPGFLWRALLAGCKCLVLFSLLVHPFFFFWGYHYRGSSLAKTIGIQTTAGSNEIDQVCRIACMRTARLRPLVLKGGTPLPPLHEVVRQGLVKLGWPTPPLPHRLKFPPIAGMLAAQRVTGVISPFTLEAHIETDLHWAQLHFTSAHELAHLAGITSEGEANFVAWYALVTSTHPLHRYSGWLGLLRFAPAWITPDAEVMQDINKIRKKNTARRIKTISNLQKKTYDVYLKSQGVKAGYHDYRGLGALAANWFASHPEHFR